MSPKVLNLFRIMSRLNWDLPLIRVLVDLRKPLTHYLFLQFCPSVSVSNSYKVHKHVFSIDLSIGAFSALESVVPKLGLMNDIFPIYFLFKKILQSVLVNITPNVDLGTKASK